MSKNHGARLDRLALVWSTCAACVEERTRVYRSVTDEEAAALAEEAAANGGELPPRVCPVCRSRLPTPIYTTVDLTRI